MPYTNLNFTITTGLFFKPFDFIQLSHDADNYIIGQVVSYDNSTGALVITPSFFQGSGTYTTWNASLTGAVGSSGTAGTSGSSPDRA